MTELEALRRVAEAARQFCNGDGPWREVLCALDALPTEAPGEMVEVHGVVKNDDGVIYMIDDSLAAGYAGHVIATITARVPVRRVPEIVATVEPAP